MDDSLTLLKHRVHKYERVYRRSKTSENKEVYRNLRKAYRNSLRFNRKYYVNRMIEECGHDTKKLYSTVSLLTNKEGEVILPKKVEDKVIANMFMNFFKTKILTIRDHLKNFPLYDPTANFSKGKKMSEFMEVTVEEVEGLVRKSKVISCVLDPIPSSIVKKHIKVLAPLITMIINSSMSQACFPS